MRVPGRCGGNKFGGVFFDVTGVRFAGEDVVARDQFVQETDIGCDACDGELVQRPPGARHRGGVVGAVDDQLGEQGVERRVGAVALIAEGIDADAGAAGRREAGEHAAGRLDRAVGLDLLHVDAQLHREAARLGHLVLRQADLAQRLAARQLDLHADEIDAGDFFRYGVFDLKPRIGLDEREGRPVAWWVGVHQELECCKAAQTDVVGQPHGGVAQLLAQRGIDAGCRRDLDNLLVAALQGAVALPDVAGGFAIAGDLDFDVARALQQRFGIDRVVAERGLGLGLAAQIGGFDLVRPVHDAHATAAAAGDRLDDDRAMRSEERARLFQRRRALCVPGQHGARRSARPARGPAPCRRRSTAHAARDR